MIDRYLANRLSDSEREVVETRIVGEPGLRHEVELTEALRDGLRVLQKQGNVAPLLKTRTGIWPRSPFAIAASVLALAAGVAALLFYQRLDRVRHEMAAAPSELVVATLRFEQTRGGDEGPDVTWQRTAAPALLDMQFDVGLDAARGYRVSIDRIGAGTDAPVLKADAAAVSPDGIASLSIRSGLLKSGDYRIRLDPRPVDPSHADPTIYTLRITD
jgi:hypothetical protein